MPTVRHRRAQLQLDRAIARLRIDAHNDLWPDPGGLIDLPRSGPELLRLKSEIGRVRDTGRAQRARAFMVPKRDGLTRPGHVLGIVERVYYQALVDTFLHSIEGRLESTGAVFGYRARYPRGSIRPFGKAIEQWLEFRKAVKAAAATGNYEAIVNTDVASFFERIDHDRLGDVLLSLGVRPHVEQELRKLLVALNGGGQRGLPQGCDASSVLGSVFLDPVDKAMIRWGYAYFRYVDDIYVMTSSEPEARRALHRLEAEMRAIGLNLQPGKTKIIVGARAIRQEILAADDEIESVDYVVRRLHRGARGRVRASWRSSSRRKPSPQRFVKYLIRRMQANRDPYALGWCLSRLGVLDWLADVVGPYLAIFANRKDVQLAITRHLASPMNLTTFEESTLLRVALSADRVRRDLVDRARLVLTDRNAEIPSRQWAAVLLGRHGDQADHGLLVRHHLEDEDLARACVVGLQGADARLRGVAYAQIRSTFPRTVPLIERIKSLASPSWPTYETGLTSSRSMTRDRGTASPPARSHGRCRGTPGASRASVAVAGRGTRRNSKPAR